MITDKAEVRTLAEKLGAEWIRIREPKLHLVRDAKYCLGGILDDESAEALARVALEWVEERERQSKRVRPGEYPTNPEEIEED